MLIRLSLKNIDRILEKLVEEFEDYKDIFDIFLTSMMKVKDTEYDEVLLKYLRYITDKTTLYGAIK